MQVIAGTGGTSVFDLHSDGKLYLQNADTTWDYLDGGVQAIAGTGGTSVFDLHSDGKLYLQNADTTWRYLDGGVQVIAGTGGTSVFDLHSDGKLYLQNADTTWDYLDGGVQAIAGTGGTSVFDLHSDGKLYLQNADTTWRYLDGGVQVIAGTGGTSVFDLHSDGKLYLQNADTTWHYLDGGVQAIAGTGGTSVFDLHSDGKLYLQDADTTWDDLDGGVQVIAGTGGTSVFDLHSDGKLYLQNADTTWHYLDGGVQAIAGTGGTSVFDLHSDGCLYLQNSDATWQLVDRLVYSISIGPDGCTINLDDWFQRNMNDPARRALVRTDFTTDDSITWSDTLGFFSQVEADGPVSAGDFHDLQVLVANAGTLNMPDYVHNLANKVVNGDPGNATHQCLDSQGNEVTILLGNLQVGSSSTQLTDLVNKWFRGVNEPVAAVSYSVASGSLFGANGPVFTDVEQGDVGDCWLMASLAEAAARQPNLLTNMFIYDGTNQVNGQTVGVWTVRLFTNGAANYVTVDTELPWGGGYYDHPANGVLWAALAEKAYAEANGSGMVQTGNEFSNSYATLNDGDAWWALSAITGHSASGLWLINPANAASALQAGELVVLCTSSPQSPYIVPSHCYALVAYDPSSSLPFEVYNPWGTNSSGWALGTYNGQQVYGLFTANAAFIAQDFDEEDLAGVAPGSVPERVSYISSMEAPRNGDHPAAAPLAMITVGSSHVNAADRQLNHALSKVAIRELSRLQLDSFATRPVGTAFTNDVADWTNGRAS